MTISQRGVAERPEKNSSRIAPIVASAYATSRISVPITPESMNTVSESEPNTPLNTAMITTTPRTTTAEAATGVPRPEDTVASGLGPTPSRDSAYSRRAAPTQHARQQAKALTAAPRLIRSPTQFPTNSDPRSPISDSEPENLVSPAGLLPKPITSTQVTNT